MRRWDGNLDVYVLDTVDGLLGRVQVAIMAEVEPMVREFLAARFTRPAGDFHVVIIGG